MSKSIKVKRENLNEFVTRETNNHPEVKKKKAEYRAIRAEVRKKILESVIPDEMEYTVLAAEKEKALAADFDRQISAIRVKTGIDEYITPTSYEDAPEGTSVQMQLKNKALGRKK